MYCYLILCYHIKIIELIFYLGDIKKKNTKRSDSKKWQKERDDACFNAPVNSELLDTEFDFEKNLALFDKQKVFDEINALSKSDHVKLVDCNKRSSSGKYRHDENILSGFVPVSRQISVPCKAEKEYVTGKLQTSIIKDGLNSI